MSDVEETIQPAATQKEKRFLVTEIFGPTIQGEGPLAGSRTMFVRFGGCDFKCLNCDSMHSVNPRAVKVNSSLLSVDAIVARLGQLSGGATRWVTLSGGNPVMWDLDGLVDRLHQLGWLVAVETQGSLWLPWLTKVNCLVVSPKTPGMGEHLDFDKLVDFFKKVQEVRTVALKMVTFSQIDVDLAYQVGKGLVERKLVSPAMLYLSLGNPYPPVLNGEYQLVDNPEIPEGGLARVLLDSYRIQTEDLVNDPRMTDWKFLPQMHVLLWGNEAER